MSSKPLFETVTLYSYRFIGSGVMGKLHATDITEAFDFIIKDNFPVYGIEITSNETDEPTLYIEYDSWPEKIKQRLKNGK